MSMNPRSRKTFSARLTLERAKHINFIDDRNEIDPIQTDTTDSGFQFDNENAVVVNLKKGKK